MQPVSAKKDEVYGVIENFLQSRDVDLEMHSGLITFLIDKIFTESDIDPDDPSTHTPANSPDLSDFLGGCRPPPGRPGNVPGATTESSQQKIQQYANELSIALHPFRPGSTFGNLSKESDLRLIDDSSKAVYLDLQQVEGSGSGLGKQSFIMQLLLSHAVPAGQEHGPRRSRSSSTKRTTCSTTTANSGVAEPDCSPPAPRRTATGDAVSDALGVRGQGSR
ncbi:hypothetical protein ACODNH_00305 (plasmid) [Haloarcula sp. NS06]|uniref:hypothetical protein n=1 Tax=Haloarcula sp. NS06 TaxID=3409688 RepID=UPI003DA6EBC8